MVRNGTKRTVRNRRGIETIEGEPWTRVACTCYHVAGCVGLWLGFSEYTKRQVTLALTLGQTRDAAACRGTNRLTNSHTSCSTP